MSKMLEVAKKAALEAGKVSLYYRDKKHQISLKGRSDSLLTEVDLACNKKILEVIGGKFPTHTIISEESSELNKSGEFTWVIDPIDGTSAYVAGLPTYGISVGLLKNSTPFIGAIYLPVYDNLYWAEKGKGSFLNGGRIKVNGNNNLGDSIIGFDFEYKGERVKEFEKTISKFIDEVRYAPVLGSVVSGLANVAQGVYEAYLQWAYVWDFAAGAVIVEEADGKLTDYHGNPIDWKKKELQVVASNGTIHDTILSLIKQ